MKKVLVLAVVAIMMLGVFGLTACEKKEEWALLTSSMCCEPVERSNVYEENSSKYLATYAEVMPYFTTTGDKHTDDFGGLFLDGDGILNVCVVGNRTPVESDYLKYKRVDQSYNFLESIVEELGKDMQKYSIWTVDTCASCNRVLICLENESQISLVIAHLKTKDFYEKNSLNFYVGENEIVEAL
jgi:hypothetical protein